MDCNSNNNYNTSVIGSSSRDDLDALIPCQSTQLNDERTKHAIEQIQIKILRTKEAIKIEQTSRDENVNEYLKLAANADKNQLQRIKSVFEKKNQKSAQTISQLQKKLVNYGKRIKDLEINGYQITNSHRPKEIIRDVGQGLKDVGTNIKEGISVVSGEVIGSIKSGISATHTAGEKVITKPIGFFKNRFGSADNIQAVEKTHNQQQNEETNSSTIDDTNEANAKEKISNLSHQHQLQSNSFTHSHSHNSHSTKYTSDDESSSITSGSGGHGGLNTQSKALTSIGSSASPAKQIFRQVTATRAHANTNNNNNNITNSNNNNNNNTNNHNNDNNSNHTTNVGDIGSSSTTGHLVDIEFMFNEMRERREDYQRLAEESETIKTNFQTDISLVHQNLQDERYRFERLEEQMNDLIELHQNEIENLKQGISDMEEKVQYQSEERLRDIQEMLESCQTRISRMEHQQHQHLQQLVNLDSLENSNARALVLKLINVLLTILQVVLLLVATLSSIVTPFLQTRIRILTTFILLIIIVILVRQWSDFSLWIRINFADRFPQLLLLFPDSDKG